MSSLNKILIILLGAISFALLGGCASPVTRDAVIVDDVTVVNQHQAAVSVATRGGSETSALGSSSISDAEFAKAIEESVLKNEVFTRVVTAENAEYLLNVTIVEMSKPSIGFNFTVRMEAAWSLVNAETKEIKLRKSIRSEYTATMGEAVVGVTRLRLAVEGAVKENIRSGLMEVSNLLLNE